MRKLCTDVPFVSFPGPILILPTSGSYSTDVWLYKVSVLGQDSRTVSTAGRATLEVGGSVSSLDTSFSHEAGVLVVRRPGVSLQQEWTISL